MRLSALALTLAACGGIRFADAQEPPAPRASAIFKIVDVDLTISRKLGVEVRTASGEPPPGSPLLARMGIAMDGAAPAAGGSGPSSFILPKNDAGFALIHTLCKQRFAVVLSEPTLTSVVGSHAQFQSGGEFPVPTDSRSDAAAMRRYGTEIDVVIKPRGDDRALVSFQLHHSEIDDSREIKVGKVKVPGLRTFETGTTFEAKWGDTFVVCHAQPGQKRDRGPLHEILRLVFVTPTLDGASTVASMPPRPFTRPMPLQSTTPSLLPGQR